MSSSKYLSNDERSMLYDVLTKYVLLFYGTLRTCETKPVDIELQAGAKPYNSMPYPVPRAHEAIFRKEVECLCQIGVLKKVNRSDWVTTTLIKPKKNGPVRFLSNIGKLNQRIHIKPFPIPKIQDVILKLEGFTCTSSLDINMGYYHIELSPGAKHICTIVLPWGRYKYKKLPMGAYTSPNIS